MPDAFPPEQRAESYDPTQRAIRSVETEIRHLRELLEARIVNLDTAITAAKDDSERALEAARLTTEQAVNAALASADKANVALKDDLERRMASLKELTKAEFVTHGFLLQNQAEIIKAALDSADKAVTKAEVFNEKRFDLITKAIDELTSTVAINAGRGMGMAAGWGYLVGGIGLIVTIVTVWINTTRGGG